MLLLSPDILNTIAMKKFFAYVVLAGWLLGAVGCTSGKSNREESARLYEEAVALLSSESATLVDCLAAQELLEQALKIDDGNIDIYFGKVLNELNLWRPDSAYRTASIAIEKIGPDGKNRIKAYFYTVKGFIAYDKGDEADARKQLSEALALYDSYLKEEPANVDYLLNKAVLLAGLEGRPAAEEYIERLPLKEEDKELLSSHLSDFEFSRFGETWRAKHEALSANGQVVADTLSKNTER